MNSLLKFLPLIVLKVGGSLFDHPALGPGLTRFLGPLRRDHRVWLVPGGGAAADAVRHWDRVHHLGEESAHWLALRSMSVAAHLLSTLIPGAEVAGRADDLRGHSRGLLVLDGYEFLQDDEGRPGSLPHAWDVTSDSVAARAAVVGSAAQLILLKSVGLPPGTSWPEAAARGWVDPYFPTAVADAPFPVEAVDFRKWLGEPSPAGGGG